jgi:hypothetical protein
MVSKEKPTFAAPALGDETRDSTCPIFLLSLSDDGD